MGLFAACSFPNGTSPFDRFESGTGQWAAGDALVPTRATPSVSRDVSVAAVIAAANRAGLDYVILGDATTAMGSSDACRTPDDAIDVFCLEQEAHWNAGPDFFDPLTLSAAVTGTVVLPSAIITTRAFGLAATFPTDTSWCLVPPGTVAERVAEGFAFTDRPASAQRITDTTAQCKAQAGLSLYSAVTQPSAIFDPSVWEGIVVADGVQGFGAVDQMAVHSFLRNVVSGRKQMLVAGSLTHNAVVAEPVGSSTSLGEWQTSLWVKDLTPDAIFESIKNGHSVIHHHSIKYRANVYDRDGRWLGTMGDTFDTTKVDPIVRVVVESERALSLYMLWIRPGGGTLAFAQLRPNEQSEFTPVAEPVCDPQCRIDVAFEIDLEPPIALVGIVADLGGRDVKADFWDSLATGIDMGQEVAVANAIWFK